MSRHDPLAVYLNDHYTGSVGAIDLVQHAAKRYSGSELGTFLAGLAREIEEDREALRAILASLDARPHRVKFVTAWLGEKAAQLKQRRAPQPLMELEMLGLGVTGKLMGWRALAAADNPVNAPLEELIGRAERQLAAVEAHRLAAARRAFVG
jgi:hypothetical protein